MCGGMAEAGAVVGAAAAPLNSASVFYSRSNFQWYSNKDDEMDAPEIPQN